MRTTTFTSRALSAALILGVSMMPQLAAAQNAQDVTLQHESNIPQQVQPQPAQPQPAPAGTVPDDTLPNGPADQSNGQNAANNGQTNTANAPAQQPASNALPDSPQPQRPRPIAPAGTAAAEKGKTYGGGASRPAGTAIAPVKQRQVRSLLIKLGLIGAAGVALGSVYGLSKSSPSNPPGSGK